jgi:hypothetical protein
MKTPTQAKAPNSSNPGNEHHSRHVANPVTERHNPSHKQKSNNNAHPGIPIVGALAPAARRSADLDRANPDQAGLSIFTGRST